MENIIKEYNNTEYELAKIKQTYEKFKEIQLQHKANICDENITEAMHCQSNEKSTKSIKGVKDLKLPPSIHNIKGLGDDHSVNKKVERKIHQFENYVNIIKQHKEPSEKISFLNMLNSD